MSTFWVTFAGVLSSSSDVAPATVVKQELLTAEEQKAADAKEFLAQTTGTLKKVQEYGNELKFIIGTASVDGYCEKLHGEASDAEKKVAKIIKALEKMVMYPTGINVGAVPALIIQIKTIERELENLTTVGKTFCTHRASEQEASQMIRATTS